MEFSLSEFTPIADRVWRAVAQPADVTIGVVAGSEGALVIDTGSTPEQGRAIRAAAEAVAGVPVVAALVTHAHWDHAFGLAAFSDVATYGHGTVAASLASDENKAKLDELGLTTSDLVAPNQPFNLAKVIHLGDRVVEVVHYGPAHTHGDVVALVNDAHVMFVGDMVENPEPFANEESDLQGWPKALDGVMGLFRLPWLIVPGHGDVVDPQFVVMQRGNLAGIYLQLEFMFTQGASPEDALARGDWGYPVERFEAAVPGLYAWMKKANKLGRPQLPVIH